MTSDEFRVRIADHLGVHAGQVTIRYRRELVVHAPTRTLAQENALRQFLDPFLVNGIELALNPLPSPGQPNGHPPR